MGWNLVFVLFRRFFFFGIRTIKPLSFLLAINSIRYISKCLHNQQWLIEGNNRAYICGLQTIMNSIILWYEKLNMHLITLLSQQHRYISHFFFVHNFLLHKLHKFLGQIDFTNKFVSKLPKSMGISIGSTLNLDFISFVRFQFKIIVLNAT